MYIELSMKYGIVTFSWLSEGNEGKWALPFIPEFPVWVSVFLFYF
jgi:hypothetical protein